MLFHEIAQLLKTPLQISRVSLKAGPFLSVDFERDDVLAFEGLQLRTERILRMQFVERRVMWGDLRREVPAPVISSLRDSAAGLDEEIREMTKHEPPIGPSLVRLLGHWRTGCVLSAKSLEDVARKANENNRTASHRDEEVDPIDYLPTALREVRQRTYPVVRALIDTLPQGNATRDESLRTFIQGRSCLDESEKDDLTPTWLPVLETTGLGAPAA